MIRYIQKGNIFDSKCQALVNAVNCVGVMGKGLAAQFAHRFPKMYNDYVIACNRNEIRPGVMHLWINSKPPPQYIVNFPTKDHWRAKSKLIYIQNGLIALANICKERHIESIALPALGCGLGHLSWNDIKKEIEQTHNKFWEQIEVEVYEPL